MASMLRTLLVWLLVLAVPAQAAAAATMAFCGPSHHGRGAAALVLQPALAQHAHHAHDGAVTHQHTVAEAQAGQGDQGDQGGSSPFDAVNPVKIGDSGQHKCSACASCCSIGAIFNTVPAVISPEVSSTRFAADVPSVERFATDGPDRPPRVVLA